MGTIDTVIKTEITRLTKREARKLVEPLREEIKRLKKYDVERRQQLNSLATRLQQMQVREHLSAKTTRAATGEIKGRLSPRLIRSLRKKLVLSQGEFAQLLDVSMVSVGNWEKGKSAPRPEMRAKLLSFRGMKRREVKLIVADIEKVPARLSKKK